MTTELACHDAACAPPPVGTGGSSPGGPARGVLSPRAGERKRQPVSVVSDNYELRKHGLREAFDGKLGDSGLTFDEVDVQFHGDKGWFIEGRLKDDVGTVAFFERSIGLKDDKLVATHETLLINEEHQGKGYAKALNDHLVDWYQKVGVDRIELVAGFDMGPYAWAVQGYRIQGEGGYNRERWVGDRLTLIERMSDDPDLKVTVRTLRKANEAREDIQPIHIASIGQDDPALHWQDPDYGDMWPGKAVLIEKEYHGSDDQSRQWDGVYYLEGREIPATVASAQKYLSDQALSA